MVFSLLDFFWDYRQKRCDIWQNWAGIVSTRLAFDTSTALLILLKNKNYENTLSKLSRNCLDSLAFDICSAFIILLKMELMKLQYFAIFLYTWWLLNFSWYFLCWFFLRLSPKEVWYLTKLSRNCFNQFKIWHQLGIFDKNNEKALTKLNRNWSDRLAFDISSAFVILLKMKVMKLQYFGIYLHTWWLLNFSWYFLS